MVTGQPDYTQEVAVTVIDTADVINVTTAPGSQPVNVTFPSVQDVNIKSQTPTLDVNIKHQDAALNVMPSLPYLPGRSKKYEDSSFLTGDSPATHDVNNDLGRNAHDGYLVNDGPGDLTWSYSDDGITYGDAHTIKQDETVRLTGLDIDSIKITWIADCGYRIMVV